MQENIMQDNTDELDDEKIEDGIIDDAIIGDDDTLNQPIPDELYDSGNDDVIELSEGSLLDYKDSARGLNYNRIITGSSKGKVKKPKAKDIPLYPTDLKYSALLKRRKKYGTRALTLEQMYEFDEGYKVIDDKVVYVGVKPKPKQEETKDKETAIIEPEPQPLSLADIPEETPKNIIKSYHESQKPIQKREKRWIGGRWVEVLKQVR